MGILRLIIYIFHIPFRRLMARAARIHSYTYSHIQNRAQTNFHIKNNFHSHKFSSFSIFIRSREWKKKEFAPFFYTHPITCTWCFLVYLECPADNKCEHNITALCMCVCEWFFFRRMLFLTKKIIEHKCKIFDFTQNDRAIALKSTKYSHSSIIIFR